MEKNESCERLGLDFYSQSATVLAPKLLGKLICRNIGGEVVRARITETECYFGVGDTACHAHKGLTTRTAVMFEEGGKAYVYLCYGLHCLFNVVTGKKGSPEAVLIRGVEGCYGPGKLTKYLEIDRSLYGEDMTVSSNLWIEDDGASPRFVASKRIGIDYASETDRERLWRFTVSE